MYLVDLFGFPKPAIRHRLHLVGSCRRIPAVDGGTAVIGYPSSCVPHPCLINDTKVESLRCTSSSKMEVPSSTHAGIEITYTPTRPHEAKLGCPAVTASSSPTCSRPVCAGDGPVLRFCHARVHPCVVLRARAQYSHGCRTQPRRINCSSCSNRERLYRPLPL